MAKLTHFDQTGSAHMVDVSSKGVTKRTAIAVGKIKVNKIAIDLFTRNKDHSFIIWFREILISHQYDNRQE